MYAISGAGTGRHFRLSNGSKLNICDCTGCGALLNREHPQADWDWAAELNSRRICIVFVVEAVRMLEEYLRELGIEA